MLKRGQQLVEEADIDCQDIKERLGHLQDSWDTLREAAAGRLQRLRDASEAQQYYLDAGEAEAWISEQELYVISDETPEVSSGQGAWLGAEAKRKSWGWAVSGEPCKLGVGGVRAGGGCMRNLPFQDALALENTPIAHTLDGHPVHQLRLTPTQGFFTSVVPWILC